MSTRIYLTKAIWLFPLYLLVINLFVLPVALGGLVRFSGGLVNGDALVLTLPMAQGWQLLTLFTFLGGLSAATAMVIVESIALSTMVRNDLIMPVLLRVRWLRLNERPDLSGLLLAIRRGSILATMLLGYLYFKLIGESHPLATTGLVSFCAAAQFAPPILFGIYWKGASCAALRLERRLPGLAVHAAAAGSALSGWLDPAFLSDGPLGRSLLRPYALFGVEGLDPISHALLWSLTATPFACSAARWSDVRAASSASRRRCSSRSTARGGPHLWRGSAAVGDLRALLARYVGAERAEQALAGHARMRGRALGADAQADPDLVNFAERLLAGARSARPRPGGHDLDRGQAAPTSAPTRSWRSSRRRPR